MNTRATKTTGIEPYVIDCICLNFSEVQALEYLSSKGYDISPAEYYRIKNDIKYNTQTRLNLIASEGFMAQHLERIDMLKMVQAELIEQYQNEKSPINKAKILMNIAEIQQYLSSFYDASRYVLEQSVKAKRKKRLEAVN
jgi:hypothetical protein